MWRKLLLAAVMVVAVSVAFAQENVDALGDPLPDGASQRLGTLRMKYTSGVNDIAYLPDGKALVAVGSQLHIWDTNKGEMVGTQTLPAGTGPMQLSKDGMRILFRSGGDVFEWDFANEKQLHRFPTGVTNLRSVVYSPDETRVLAAGTVPPVLKEFDLASGNKLIEIKGDFATFANAIYGPDGKTAFVGGGYDNVVAHYDLTSGEKLHEFVKNYNANTLALSSDGARLLVGSRSYASEWKIDGEYTELKRFGGHHGGAVNAVAYCADTDQILTGSRDGSIRRWDRNVPEVLLRWFPHESYVTMIRVSPDGQRVLSYGAGLVAESFTETGKSTLTWDRHIGAVEAVMICADQRHCVSASTDETLRLWDMETGKTVRVMTGAKLGAYCVAVSPDQKRVAAGCKDGMLREWSLENGAMLRELSGHLGYVWAVAYTHTGDRLLSSADDGTVRVWSQTADEPLAILRGHLGGVLSIAVSQDDSTLLSAGRDGTVRVWDLNKGELRGTLNGHRGWVNAVSFAGRGRYAVSAGRDGRILRWNLQAMKLVDDIEQGTWIKVICASPDGQHVYVAGDDATIACWDLADRVKTAELKGHKSGINSLAIAEDGATLISASADTTLLVWDVQ